MIVLVRPIAIYARLAPANGAAMAMVARISAVSGERSEFITAGDYHPATVLRLPDTHRLRSGQYRANPFRLATPRGAVWQTMPTMPARGRQVPRRWKRPGLRRCGHTEQRRRS